VFVGTRLTLLGWSKNTGLSGCVERISSQNGNILFGTPVATCKHRWFKNVSSINGVWKLDYVNCWRKALCCGDTYCLREACVATSLYTSLGAADTLHSLSVSLPCFIFMLLRNFLQFTAAWEVVVGRRFPCWCSLTQRWLQVVNNPYQFLLLTRLFLSLSPMWLLVHCPIWAEQIVITFSSSTPILFSRD
jgi:hypothetical protein